MRVRTRSGCRSPPGTACAEAAAVAVVVPAHDEQELVGACLGALQGAAAASGLPPVRVLVVADACRDRTAAVARAEGAEVLEVDLRNAGAARRAGFAAVLEGAVPDRLWLATTDADTRVPPTWLADQLAWRERGWDAVVGTVQVDDWTGHDEAVVHRYAQRYAWTGAEHPHVHGANLSLTAAAYLAVGGFPPLPLAEDVALVAALQAGGHRVARTALSPVLTSARRSPRCQGGFGSLLLQLAT